MHNFMKLVTVVFDTNKEVDLGITKDLLSHEDKFGGFVFEVEETEIGELLRAIEINVAPTFKDVIIHDKED